MNADEFHKKWSSLADDLPNFGTEPVMVQTSDGMMFSIKDIEIGEDGEGSHTIWITTEDF